MSRRGSLCAALVLVGAWVATPRAAHASACCGSSYGLGGRLTQEETAAVYLGVRTSSPVASWNNAASPRVTRTLNHELRLDVSALMRVADALQLGVTVPWLFNARDLLGSARSGTGLGDTRLMGRWEPLTGRAGLPDVALTFSSLLPSGRPYAASKDLLAADVTGQGLTEFRTGVAVEKTWMSGFMVAAQASVGWQAAGLWGDGWALKPPSLQLVAALGPTFFHRLSTVVGVQHDRQVPLTQTQVENRSRTTALGLCTWEISERWTAVASVTSDIPLPLLGRNEEVQVALAAGLRWVWPSWNED